MHFMFLLPRSELEGSIPSLQLGYYDLINQINFFLLETSLGVVTESNPVHLLRLAFLLL